MGWEWRTNGTARRPWTHEIDAWNGSCDDWNLDPFDLYTASASARYWIICRLEFRSCETTRSMAVLDGRTGYFILNIRIGEQMNIPIDPYDASRQPVTVSVLQKRTDSSIPSTRLILPNQPNQPHSIDRRLTLNTVSSCHLKLCLICRATIRVYVQIRPTTPRPEVSEGDSITGVIPGLSHPRATRSAAESEAPSARDAPRSLLADAKVDAFVPF